MAVIRVFGRREEFDEQSRTFPIRALIPRGTVPRSYTWRCSVTLDQGSSSACTGFSVAQEAAARPVVVPGITNLIGRALYERAKQLDQWPGEGYDGSSVLGAIKAGAEKGWYPEYRWAFSEKDLCLAVGFSGPAVLGINWYEGMSSPDATGLIKVTGRLQGGHAILCVGVNVKTKLYRLHNSWGPGWGKNGECFIAAADLARLLRERGEACIPVKRHV
jgi:hypothetical protein